MKIVPFSPELKNDFVELNKVWISAMFRIEPADIEEFSNTEKAIENGAQIFFALDDNKTVLACCMIRPCADNEWEILKFAAKGMSTGTGAGSACFKACIDYAKQQNAAKIIIVSNKKLSQALHIYRKFGFTEVPVDKTKFPFERGDIAFELVLKHEKIMTKSEKISVYETVLPQIESLVLGVKYGISSLANIAAVLQRSLNFFWTGFYVVEGDTLLLGPFQGDVACIKIPKGKGVCGTAWQERKTIVVEDVEKFPGHIACSSLSKSEIVVPVFSASGEITAVLDIDSDRLATFDDTDKMYLEKVVEVLKGYERFV